MYPHNKTLQRVDAVAINHYGDLGEKICEASDLKRFIDAMHEATGLPVWITEFACRYWPQPNDELDLAYLKEALPMLEAHPAVQRYFYFTGRSKGFNATQLFAGGYNGTNSSLSALGEYYFSYPANFAD